MGDELAVFLPEEGAEIFWGGFNLLELKSEVVDIRNYTCSSATASDDAFFIYFVGLSAMPGGVASRLGGGEEKEPREGTRTSSSPARRRDLLVEAIMIEYASALKKRRVQNGGRGMGGECR